jgi:putative spermidine/putrescine transport system ATP-binding protein
MSESDRERPTGNRLRALEMRKVSRWYGRTPALTDLDLQLDRGEFVALLGPSGCGKSTALACLAGLQPLTAGSIWRDGQRIDVLPPHKRGFGMVFQNYALFPHLSVQRNVEFGLAMRKVGRPERRRRAQTALDLVQLADQAHKLPSQLSGGQQQRVAIARALAIDPEVVLMDEPLSNLDAALRVEMRTEIKRLYQERELTVLYVTHDQEEALSLATRLVVLRAGRLVQTGTPQQVYTQPASAYVAGFMGYRNLVPAKLETAADGDHQVVVAVRDVRLRGTVDAQTRLAEGADVLCAVRPEDFVLGGTGGNDVCARAEVVEYHGRELHVRARTGDGVVLHFTTSEPVPAGAEVTLGIPPERVLVFPGDDQLPSKEKLPRADALAEAAP